MHKEGKTPLKAEIFIASLFKKGPLQWIFAYYRNKVLQMSLKWLNFKQVFSCDYCDAILMYSKAVIKGRGSYSST